MPAEACGIVGFRPSPGRYPSAGVVPADPTRDTPGPMGATAADVVLLDSVITGTPIADYSAAELAGLRVALPKDCAAAAAESAGYKAALELAVGALKKGGATINAEATEFMALGSANKPEKELALPARATRACSSARHCPKIFTKFLLLSHR